MSREKKFTPIKEGTNTRRCQICNRRLSIYNHGTECFSHAIDPSFNLRANNKPWQNNSCRTSLSSFTITVTDSD